MMSNLTPTDLAIATNFFASGKLFHAVLLLLDTGSHPVVTAKAASSSAGSKTTRKFKLQSYIDDNIQNICQAQHFCT